MINKNDIEGALPQEMLNAAIRGDEQRVANAISFALSMISSEIGGKYDCDYIFSQQGDARHPLIKQFAISIAAWHVLSNGLNPRNLPEIFETAYDNAIKSLQRIANDKSNPDLPLRQTAQKSTRVKLSPGNKKSHRW